MWLVRDSGHAASVLALGVSSVMSIFFTDLAFAPDPPDGTTIPA
jgi:hypothetical protein